MITGGFGFQLDVQTGAMRRWYLDRAGVKRWADNDEPVKQPVPHEILLRCPSCGKTKVVEREPMDYLEAAVIETTCLSCWNGGPSEKIYLDRDGKHITRDPEDRPEC